MKKFIFGLLLAIFMIPGVNAECINLFEATTDTFYVQSSGTTKYYRPSLDGVTIYEVPLTTGSTYTFFATKDDIPVEKLMDSTQREMIVYGNSYTYDTIPSYVTFEATTEAFSFLYRNFNSTDFSAYDGWKYWLVEGNEVCTPSVEEPDVPDEPVIPDATLDTFYSIYLDKLVNLANYSIENKFILSAFVIILVFICLDIFIYLFKGGYRR